MIPTAGALGLGEVGHLGFRDTHADWLRILAQPAAQRSAAPRPRTSGQPAARRFTEPRPLQDRWPRGLPRQTNLTLYVDAPAAKPRPTKPKLAAKVATPTRSLSELQQLRSTWYGAPRVGPGGECGCMLVRRLLLRPEHCRPCDGDESVPGPANPTPVLERLLDMCNPHLTGCKYNVIPFGAEAAESGASADPEGRDFEGGPGGLPPGDAALEAYYVAQFAELLGATSPLAPSQSQPARYAPRRSASAQSLSRGTPNSDGRLAPSRGARSRGKQAQSHSALPRVATSWYGR